MQINSGEKQDSLDQVDEIEERKMMR